MEKFNPNEGSLFVGVKGAEEFTWGSHSGRNIVIENGIEKEEGKWWSDEINVWKNGDKAKLDYTARGGNPQVTITRNNGSKHIMPITGSKNLFIKFSGVETVLLLEMK